MSSSQTLRVLTLLRAAELSGGEAELAAFLRIRRRTLRVMLDGLAAVPEEIFLRAVDLVTAGDLRHLCERIAENRQQATERTRG